MSNTSILKDDRKAPKSEILFSDHASLRFTPRDWDAFLTALEKRINRTLNLLLLFSVTKADAIRSDKYS